MITDDIIEKVLHARVPGGSEVWHVVDGGGMAVHKGHRAIVRKVLEAYEANRSRQLDQLIEAVELRMAIAAAYNPLPAERRRLGLLAGIPADAGTPAVVQLRRAANKKLEAVLATCKAGG